MNSCFVVTRCPTCAKELAHDAPRCVRCWTRYCNASCQLEHWSNGHKKQCKKIARAGGAEQFHADAKAKEAADVAVVACRPNIAADAICFICRDDASREGLVHGCACRGTSGLAHVSCLARQAQSNVVHFNGGDGWASWEKCNLCGQVFRGPMMHALGWACWKAYATRGDQFAALMILAQGLTAVREHAEALQIRETILGLYKRQLELCPAGRLKDEIEVHVIRLQQDVAASLSQLGRTADAIAVERRLYARSLTMYGAATTDTILAAYNLGSSYLHHRMYKEAIEILREQLPISRRVLGPSHERTLHIGGNLVGALMGAASRLEDLLEAKAIIQDVLEREHRVFGENHPNTQTSRCSLAGVEKMLAHVQRHGWPSGGFGIRMHPGF